MQLDQAAFLEIYEAYFSRVYNYISYRINDHGDVEDLVSQVFTRIVEKHATYNPGKGCIEAWVIGVARNAVTDYYRDRGKRETADIETVSAQLLSGEAQPEDIVVRNENHRCLIEALCTLSERERSVIALKYGAELSNRQIARQMSLSVSNIGVILFRSLRKLRARLGKEVRL